MPQAVDGLALYMCRQMIQSAKEAKICDLFSESDLDYMIGSLGAAIDICDSEEIKIIEAAIVYAETFPGPDEELVTWPDQAWLEQVAKANGFTLSDFENELARYQRAWEVGINQYTMGWER